MEHRITAILQILRPGRFGRFVTGLGLVVGLAFPVPAQQEITVPGHDEPEGSIILANEMQEEFTPPGEEISLQGSLEIGAESSILENDARLKARLDNALSAQIEGELVKFIDMEIGDDYKRRVLLALGEIYERQKSPSRLIALYEKFIVEFPKDREVPKMFLRLGRMYRDAGAINTALAKFYNVLNVALNVPVQELKDYQEVSHRAQLEIAETFFSIGSYDQAAKFFKRLLRLNLTREDFQNVLFKYSYTIFLAEDYQEAITSLRAFLKEFPQSNLAPEARYLLADSYLRLNDPKAALRETLRLLASEVNKIDSNPEAWLYWKKRTGNKLANQFYQETNYLDALTIYQAMVNLSNDPTWRWPVLYQIGLCYEKLDMKPKSIEAYQQIVDSSSDISEKDRDDLTLQSILDMAQWRRDQLGLDLDTEFDLQQILNNG